MPSSGDRRVVLPESVHAPAVPPLFRAIAAAARRGPAVVDFGRVRSWDSAGLALLGWVGRQAPGLTAVDVPPEMTEARRTFATEAGPPADEPAERPLRFLRLGEAVLARGRNALRFTSLLADEVYHLASFFRRRRGVYPGETANQLFFMAVKSFPIVSVLIFLTGVTISLMTANQLRLFGADIYLADFVGLAMFREIVPLMTGIILAGKVGAAVTAELSTMVVLEEVDALTTMGIVPERFLMVPRLLGITLAIPLLVGVADVVGIFAGLAVGWLRLGIPVTAFLEEMRTIVFFSDFALGFVKTLTFGWAVVIAAGYKGLSAGRSASEVGRATTESVVLSVSLIVLLDCLFAFYSYR